MTESLGVQSRITSPMSLSLMDVRIIGYTFTSFMSLTFTSELKWTIIWIQGLKNIDDGTAELLSILLVHP